MAPKPRSPGLPPINPTIEAQILEQLTEVKRRVEDSLQQGRENGNELKMLRRELGLDGAHGRLPIVEAALVRHETQMERIDSRLIELETENSEAEGKAKLVATAAALLGGGAGGAVISWIAHLLGGR
jgi:hypothetical protein